MMSTLRGVSVPSRNCPMHQHHDSPPIRAGSSRYGGRLRAAALYMCPVSASTSHTQPVCSPRRSVTSSSVFSSASCTEGELFNASAMAPTISSSRAEVGISLLLATTGDDQHHAPNDDDGAHGRMHTLTVDGLNAERHRPNLNTMPLMTRNGNEERR